ncbi:MAG: class I SAM-dependent methyltransferase [Opitutae bacterium]|nr:class I SAM-dependent methyltransferase [Opitutae bacterium]
MSFKDHFSTQAATYARARPTYPSALFAELARLAPGRALAWDCGAGNGQAAVGLAEHFERVVATEPSAAQLAAAAAHPRVVYQQSAETVSGVADGAVDLVTAAQAAHWFNRPAFYAEVQRVLRPGGVVALVSYGFCAITPGVDALVQVFYSETLGPYWPPERVLVETGYRDFDFPFAEFAFPAIAMEHAWALDEFADYLRSWSAVARYRQARGSDPVAPLRERLATVWGDAGQKRRIVWPLAGRIGRRM